MGVRFFIESVICTGDLVKYWKYSPGIIGFCGVLILFRRVMPEQKQRSSIVTHIYNYISTIERIERQDFLQSVIPSTLWLRVIQRYFIQKIPGLFLHSQKLQKNCLFIK